jgi:aryl-alcohol dehydrogenase-like predicted oxidoreductase
MGTVQSTCQAAALPAAPVLPGIGRVDRETADTAIQTCLDDGGNHIDVAPGYGDATAMPS